MLRIEVLNSWQQLKNQLTNYLNNRGTVQIYRSQAAPQSVPLATINLVQASLYRKFQVWLAKQEKKLEKWDLALTPWNFVNILSSPTVGWEANLNWLIPYWEVVQEWLRN
jgi:hypothetical protein